MGVSFFRGLECSIQDSYCIPLSTKKISYIDDESLQEIEIDTRQIHKVHCFSIDKKRSGSLDPVMPYFNTHLPGICKKNDLFITCHRGDTYTFVVELKKVELFQDKSWAQIENGKIFFDFVKNKVVLNHAVDDAICKIFGLICVESKSSRKRTLRKSSVFATYKHNDITHAVFWYKKGEVLPLLELMNQCKKGLLNP